jgi:hypothetical protein
MRYIGISYRIERRIDGEEMKESDCYLKWVEWSDEDQTYIGKRHDLISGIHGEDPITLYDELCEVIEDV